MQTLKKNNEKFSDFGWKSFASMFTEKESMIKKECPKNAFLDLCEEGLVKGVPKGKYTKSYKNNKYAIQAVMLLKENESLKDNPKQLWNQIEDTPDSYNHQLDIVCALWNNDLINA